MGRTARFCQLDRHHPRRRMIQYSETLVMSCGLTAYWMPASAGMTCILCLHPLHHSNTEQPLAAQEREQLQERQAEDGKMIAFDALEQMHSQSFQLVGTDA